MAEKNRLVGNPDCYACGLGDCSGPVNREHYVSKAILERVGEGKVVLVSNLAHQRQPRRLKERGVAGLVARVLCEGHNRRLSPFDQAGLDLFVGLERLFGVGAAWSPYLRRARIDGDAVERWMLKTACGGLFSGNFRAPDGLAVRGVAPRRDWLDMLFGGADFPDGQGLYLALASDGAVVNSGPHVLRVSGLFSQAGDAVGGLHAEMFGFHFVLLAEANKPEGEAAFRQCLYRPAGVAMAGGGERVDFRWKGGPRSGDCLVRPIPA